MFKNMRISRKIGSVLFVVLVLLVAVMATYQHAITSTTNGFQQLLAMDTATSQHAASVAQLMLQCRRNEKDFLLR